jgi:LuxR family maltose regulon positive regulatory protein
LARVQLAQGQPAEALAVLEGVRSAADASGRVVSLVETLVLEAVAHQAQGDGRTALDRLVAALALAAPEDQRRPFVDAGPPLASLLHQAQHVAPTFVDCLLTAIGHDAAAVRQDTRADPQRASNRPQLLIEPLSEQELIVLRLLSEGLSNQDIAERLVITRGTAKWHVHNLYAKLGVSGRTKAIVRARALNLL